ncbi:Arc family DNA-binding protein [Christensenella tenuis]|uniref:Arc family DNA-binding protein n=1 Tax=Christensenella tenuis TaxID=2763033 RepID=A0ABR7EIG0_9FIRM|nr:Arc family DNA-binding protein [Christensenella tenuis]MBC5648919.1 Arc family DNA-binding protein [Christensenella tenuis]
MGNYFSPFSLRIPEELLEKIKVIAEKNKRSANKEIEFIISEYVCAYEEKNGTIKTTAE